MSREIYGIPGRIMFENKEYNSPQEVEKYLSKLYGDYMKLPPIEGRYDAVKILVLLIIDNFKTRFNQ